MEIGGRRVPGWILVYLANGIVWIVAGLFTDEQRATGALISLGFLALTAWLFLMRVKWFWVLSVVAAAFMLISGTTWLFDDDFDRGWAGTLAARGATDLIILISTPAQRWMGARYEEPAETESPATPNE